MPVDDKLEAISQDGKFRKVWSGLKDVILKADNLTKEQRLALASLYKEFNQGLSAELASFEKAKTSVNATKHAHRAIQIIESYQKKFDGYQGDVPEDAKAKIGKLLAGMKEFLSKSVWKIEDDELHVVKRVKERANDAKLHKCWAIAKKRSLEVENLDKDDKKTLKKLYESFDSGLSGTLKKYEKANSDEEALEHAKEAIKVIDTYVKKIDALPKSFDNDSIVSIKGVLVEMKELIETWLDDFE